MDLYVPAMQGVQVPSFLVDPDKSLFISTFLHTRLPLVPPAGAVLKTMLSFQPPSPKIFPEVTVLKVKT